MKANDLYEHRMLIFVEKEPQSNIYYQVALDAEQYKKVSFDICSKKLEDGTDEYEIHGVNTTEEEYRLPDLKEIYE